MNKKRHYRKKIILLLGFILVALIFASCGSKTLNEAQKAFDSGEYEKAIGIINDSEESVEDNEELKSLYISIYEKWGEELLTSGDYQQTIEVLNDSKIEISNVSTIAAIYSDAWHKYTDQMIEDKNYYQAYDLLSKMVSGGITSAEESKETYYLLGERFSEDKQYAAAGLSYAKAGDYSDAMKKCSSSWDKGAFRNTACLEDYTALGIKPDGTVASAINTDLIDSVENASAKLNRANTKINTKGWTDMVSVLCNEYYYVGLDSKGQVKVGETGCTVFIPDEKLSSPEWTDIVSIDLEGATLAGLTKEGKVLIAGDGKADYSAAESWESIVQVSLDYDMLSGTDVFGNVHVINALTSSDSYDEEDPYDNPFTESELQEKNIGQFIGHRNYGVYVTKTGELYTTATPERAEKIEFQGESSWMDRKMEYEDYKGLSTGKSGVGFVSCDTEYDYYIGLCSNGSVKVGGDMGSILEGFGINKWKDIKEAHLGMGGNPVVYGITADGTLRLTGYEGGIYMPYHEKIRSWGELKAPTIEYDTSEFN